METFEPHKNNVPGSFYVCDGCCTACDVPFDGTSDMFTYDSDMHCYVSKQPETKDDLTRMIRTLLSTELECVRYRGSDPDVLRRLGESGSAHLSDIPIEGIDRVLRDHVSFEAVNDDDRLLNTQDLAASFEKYFLSRQSEYSTYKFKNRISVNGVTTFEYSWFEDNFHKVEVFPINDAGSRWLVVSDTPFQIYDWLFAEGRFCDIRCYTEEEWKGTKNWRETPW